MANIFKQSYSMHSIHIYFQTYEKLLLRIVKAITQIKLFDTLKNKDRFVS